MPAIPSSRSWSTTAAPPPIAAARKKAYSAAIKMMTEKAYWLPLFTYVNTYAFSKQLDFKTFPDELPRFYFAKWQ